MTVADHADELVDILLAEIDGHENDTDRQIIYSRVRRALAEHPLAPPVEKPLPGMEPMTDVEARTFEFRLMPWGTHKGRSIGDVPIRDLCWLADPNEFIGKIRRYLKSRIGRQRIETENES